MFKGGFGNLEMQGDHLDLSYRDPDAWPSLTPLGSIKSFTFDIGDPVAGPSVQLGLMRGVEEEVLDWKHSIDPVHHHGSDQFRVVSGGEWILAGKSQPAGDYSFQESGLIYQEHPGDGGNAWVALLMGDRRGTESTLALERDRATVFAAGSEYGQPQVEGASYTHPAGHNGIAAIATSEGLCKSGYLRGKIDALPPGAPVTGLLGEPSVGPVVHVIKAGPDELAIPACTYATELVLIVAGGSACIGDKDYVQGDLRIQRADTAIDAVIAGAGGLQAVLIVGDRRVRPVTADGTLPGWMRQTESVLESLDPRPGGVHSVRQRAALRAVD